MGCTEKNKWQYHPLLFVFLMIISGAVVGLARYYTPITSEPLQVESPVEKLTGEYPEYGFRLMATDENTVYVTPLSREPRKNFRALNAALDKVEKTAGRKVWTIGYVGSPVGATIFYLEENPESK